MNIKALEILSGKAELALIKPAADLIPLKYKIAKRLTVCLLKMLWK